MYFSAKRQQYLIDQGYTFKVIQDLVERANENSTLLKSKQQELDLLACIIEDSTVFKTNEEDEDKAIKKLEGNLDSGNGGGIEMTVPKRRTANISNLSGATGTIYAEMKRR